MGMLWSFRERWHARTRIRRESRGFTFSQCQADDARPRRRVPPIHAWWFANPPGTRPSWTASGPFSGVSIKVQVPKNLSASAPYTG